MITGKTKIYGIFGHPVEHTFSPGMHNAAFNAIGVDACYVPFSVSPEDLRAAIQAVAALGIRGLNITVPHKEKVMPFLDDITDDARIIGAVNTVEIQQGRLIGHNTDGRGFLRSIRQDAGFQARGKVFCIMGAGGAARAVGCSLALAGAKMVYFHDVDEKKAERLVRGLVRHVGRKATAVDIGEFERAAISADCLVNATPLGLRPSDPLPIPSSMIQEQHLICDLIYNPASTKLLTVARRRGARTMGGMGMLLYQGVIAFEIWMKTKAPVPVMRKALSEQVAARRK